MDLKILIILNHSNCPHLKHLGCCMTQSDNSALLSSDFGDRVSGKWPTVQLYVLCSSLWQPSGLNLLSSSVVVNIFADVIVAVLVFASELASLTQSPAKCRHVVVFFRKSPNSTEDFAPSVDQV